MIEVLPGIELYQIELLALLLVAAAFDIRRGMIPDKLILAGFALAALNLLFARSPALAVSSLLGALAGGLPLFILIAVSRGGMGAGDMKLMAMAGAFTGPAAALIIMVIAFVACGLYAAVLLALGLKTLQSKLVFAPFIALGGFAYVLFNRQIFLLLEKYYGILLIKY